MKIINYDDGTKWQNVELQSIWKYEYSPYKPNIIGVPFSAKEEEDEDCTCDSSDRVDISLYGCYCHVRFYFSKINSIRWICEIKHDQHNHQVYHWEQDEGLQEELVVTIGYYYRKGS